MKVAITAVGGRNWKEVPAMLEMLKGTLQGIKLSALAVPPPRPGLEQAATPDRAKETPARKLLWIVALALLGLVFVIAALAV